MRAKLWLRIACVFILVHLLGHAMGHSTWHQPADPEMQKVVDAMVSYKGEFMGASRSMGDYYNGYSLILFFVYAMSIAILWAASGDTSSSQTLIKRILYPMAFAWIAFGVIEFIYFFPFAAAMSLSAGLFIFSAIVRMEINARQQY